MLEIKVPAQSMRARAAASRMASTPPVARTAPGRAVSARAARSSGIPAPPRPQAPRRAARSASASRLVRSEARLLAVAVGSTLTVCGLLVLYLAAYAHVTLLGIDQSQARAALRARRLENETLKAECAALQNPQRVVAEAARLGMVRGAPRVDYIPQTDQIASGPEITHDVAARRAATNNKEPRMGGQGEAGPRMAIRGKTINDYSAASGDY